MRTSHLFTPLFDLGDVVATPAIAALIEDGLMVDLYLTRHHAGAVRVVMVLDEEGGPAFSMWRPYSFFVDNSRLLRSEVDP